MQTTPGVYVSLTSIPGRSSTLKVTLDCLILQDYTRMLGIVVTVPLVNFRGMPFANNEDWTWLSNEPYVGKNVILNRPLYDYGPCMKYVGATAFPCPRDEDDDTWVFVCDDDVRYAPGRVTDLVSQITNKNKVIASAASVFGLEYVHSSFFSPLGFKGVLLHRKCLLAVAEKLTKLAAANEMSTCCAMNDDVLAGLLLYGSGYSFTRDRRNRDVTYSHERGTAAQKNSLSSAGNVAKYKAMLKCHLQHNRKNVACAASVLSLLVFVFLLAAIAIPVALLASREKSRGQV